jgi:pentose-5-phosphate-3-epimerase
VNLLADLKALAERIRAKKMKFGLALKPKTQIDESIRGLIQANLVDMMLIMTVGEFIIYLNYS